MGVDKTFLPFKDPRPAHNKQYSRVEAASLLRSSRVAHVYDLIPSALPVTFRSYLLALEKPTKTKISHKTSV